MIRPATADDADDLARIHVTSWAETYTGLLPPEEIASRTPMVRLRQWQNQIAAGSSRIMLLPGLGFAQAGPQRDPTLIDRYPQELYALYLLQKAQGTGQGRALLMAATTPEPMTALVLAGNSRAVRFYRRSGGQIIDTRDDHIGQATISEHLIVWPQGWKTAQSPSAN